MPERPRRAQTQVHGDPRRETLQDHEHGGDAEGTHQPLSSGSIHRQQQLTRIDNPRSTAQVKRRQRHNRLHQAKLPMRPKFRRAFNSRVRGNLMNYELFATAAEGSPGLRKLLKLIV